MIGLCGDEEAQVQLRVTHGQRDPFLMLERAEKRVRGCGGLGFEPAHDVPQPLQRFVQRHWLSGQSTSGDTGDLRAGAHRPIKKLLFPKPHQPFDKERHFQRRTGIGVFPPHCHVAERLAQGPVAQSLETSRTLPSASRSASASA